MTEIKPEIKKLYDNTEKELQDQIARTNPVALRIAYWIISIHRFCKNLNT